MLLTIACLCAQWCSNCRAYRATFDTIARGYAGVRFVWIDIEDEAELVGPIDVENFPTLLIGSELGPLFFGPITQQPEVLKRLLQTHLADEPRTPLDDVDVAALLARLRSPV
jgi:thioredoxin 1